MAKLRDLGLSEYEARAYRSLLRTGPTTAKELSRASDVPMGRIYDVLNGLEQYGLVRSQAASRPKQYVAVEPDVGMERLLADRKEELAEKESQYEAVAEELTDQLDAAEPVDEGFWTAAVGPEESTDLLLQRLSLADERIVIASGHPSQQFDIDEVGRRIVAELEAALERGATVSALIHPGVVRRLPQDVIERYERHLLDHDDFEVRTSEALQGSFYLIDEGEVCIEVPNPLDPEGLFALIDLKDAEFAGNLREAFRPRWEEADQVVLSS